MKWRAKEMEGKRKNEAFRYRELNPGLVGALNPEGT
jgi:hypothetical protein